MPKGLIVKVITTPLAGEPRVSVTIAVTTEVLLPSAGMVLGLAVTEIEPTPMKVMGVEVSPGFLYRGLFAVCSLINLALVVLKDQGVDLTIGPHAGL